VYSKDKSKADSIEQVVQEIKDMTIEMDTRTVLVSHFQKIDEAKKPTMTNFKDSISIAQTADTIIMLWRDKSESQAVNTQYETDFIIAKNRLDVPAMTIRATFDTKLNRYIGSDGCSYGTKNSDIRQDVEVREEAKVKCSQFFDNDNIL
jgi:replicative DNA helicase